MRLSERRKEGSFYFAVHYVEGGMEGGDVEIRVFAPGNSDGVLILSRLLYFDEQSQEHIDNFCREFAYDEKYRNLCLSRGAHWQRVAALYLINARIMEEEWATDPNDLEKSSRELFHVIRRDLALIEDSYEYRQEMARKKRGTEDDMEEAFQLMAGVKDAEVLAACQGVSSVQMGGRNIYLPSCHSVRATVVMSKFPSPLRTYLQSGPLGQHHLAVFEENLIRAAAARHNKRFAKMLTASLHAYLRKQA